MYSAKRIKAFLNRCDTYALLTVFSVCLCLYGCIDNDLVNETNLPGKDSIAVISLNVKQQTSDQVTTRTPNENDIQNIHVLVYNSNGSLTGHGYATGNSLNMEAVKGTGCTIFAIANTGNPTLFNDGSASTINKLMTLTSRELVLTNGVFANGLENDNYLLMSGCLTNVTLGLSNIINDLKVKRLVGKINFSINAINGITITGYSIKNLPNKEYLIAHPYINELSPENLTPGTDAATAWLNPNAVSLSNGTTAHSFNFYMYENRRGGRKLIDGSIGNDAEQKEKAKYAPDNSTYVEITAKGNSASPNMDARFTSAVYRIYLGADNSKNYNVTRNCTYTITANIKSATDIDTRVTKVSLPSNCYIVKPNSYVMFPVFKVDNINKQRIFSIGSNWKAELLWTDKSNYLTPGGTVKSVTAQPADGTILVETGSTEGNAVVVAKVDGVIVWSWHIWVTSYDPNTTNISYNNGAKITVFMDRNLGAISNTPQNVGSMGLLYQWGRKDPFPGSLSYSVAQEPTVYGSNSPVINKLPTPSTVSPKNPDGPPNNIENCIQNPSAFYYKTEDTQGSNEYDWYSTTATHDASLWGGNSSKSVYDPSPEGWRVPKSGSGTSSPWFGLTTGPIFNYGYNWSSSVGWYPATGYRKYRDGGLMKIGEYGVCWSASVSPEQGNKSYVYLFYFRNGMVVTDYTEAKNELKDYYRASGFPIRCVKE